MGLFPTDAVNGQQVTNANGTTFEYVAVDDKWIIINTLIISDIAYNAGTWDANSDGATKNVIRDKIETMEAEIDGNCTTAEAHAYVEANPLTMENDIVMGSHKITGLVNAVNPQDAMAFSQKYTNANAVSAVATADDYIKNNANDVMAGNLTVNNLITAGLVDGIDVSDKDANSIKGITIDNTDIANNKILKYNSTSGNLEYETDDTGAGFVPPIGFITMFSGTWVNNSTIPGWYKCDGNNGTVNLVNKFVRGGTTSGTTGGSDNAVVVSHRHGILVDTGTSLGVQYETTAGSSQIHTEYSGVSGSGANKPAYYTLIFIQRIS